MTFRDWTGTYERESDLSDAVRAHLAARGDHCITRVEAGGTSRRNRRTEAGSGDLQGCVIGGVHVELELKARTGRSRPAQLDRCRKVRSMGGVYEVCRTVKDVNDAIEAAKMMSENRRKAG